MDDALWKVAGSNSSTSTSTRLTKTSSFCFSLSGPSRRRRRRLRLGDVDHVLKRSFAERAFSSHRIPMRYLGYIRFRSNRSKVCSTLRSLKKQTFMQIAGVMKRGARCHNFGVYAQDSSNMQAKLRTTRPFLSSPKAYCCTGCVR